MNTSARKHHYVTAEYLGGFADARGRLCVIDLVREQVRLNQAPHAIGHKRDLHRVDAPGVPPDEVEVTMASIEGPGIGAIQRAIATGRVPEGEDLSWVVAFIALHAARVPRVRAVTSLAVEQASLTMLRMSVATPERWAALRESVRAGGSEEMPDVPYQEMREYIERADFKISAGNTWEVLQALDQAQQICGLLLHRNWTLLAAVGSADHFVCSADPVGLNWSTPRPPSPFSPGFALPETDVTFPLSSRLALLGRFEPVPEVIPADTAIVAAVNSMTGRGADEVYARAQDLPWLGPDHTIRRGGLLDSWKASRAAAEGGKDV